MMTVVFELNEITKRFGNLTALDRVSLVGKPGQVIALLGENGAGKTTAIKILLGLMNPDNGSATVLGMSSGRHGQEIRRQVGYVPDRPVLYEWMTVAEIGWFAAGFYPLGFQDEYRRLVAGFQLPLDRPLKALSKGMLAKVGLALALAHKPQLLVMDEPTSGLDPLVRREFLESMIDVAATGRTVLLSSHQIAEVERVADVVVILRKGRIVVSEPLDVLKERVCRIVVTRETVDETPPPLPDEATLLDARHLDRQWQVLVRDLTDEGLAMLQSAPGIVSAERQRLSLEEVFVACMQGVQPERWIPIEAASSVAAIPGEVQP